MFIKKILLNTKKYISIIFRRQKVESSDRCENLTSIPGIGKKNCNNFYEAGYMTPESIISASDEELLSIPGVGIGFIEKLRKTLGRV
tara:strand:+ start:286 stop:546 length:261 start_codon:yes stop_codon:yes gene_type:complete